jgi:hypothetical protein
VESQALNPLEAYLRLDAADSTPLPQQEGQKTLPQTLYSAPWDFSFDFSSQFSDAAAPFYIPEASSIYPIAAQTEAGSSMEELPNTISGQEDTTLCSVAFSLVMTSNRKGYSTADLDLKLRAGYRNGYATSEGCRIENRILLRVLTEII